MSQIPKVTVAPSDGGWLAGPSPRRSRGFFWHRLRHAADEAAVAHQRADMRKVAS